MQTNCNITHESNQHQLHWTDSYSIIQKNIQSYRDKQSQFPKQIYGDVHFAHLPYVFQIAYQFPETRFVCLVRNKKETVSSWIRKVEKRNPWINHQSEFFDSSPWDRCFPKLGIPNPKQAAESYWELYLQTALSLKSEFPKRFAMFPTESLNSQQGQHQILDHLGIPFENRVYVSRIHKNASTTNASIEKDSK